jgi:hypothetical protein
MRRLFWVIAISIGAIAVIKRQLALRAEQRAQETAAEATWDSEGGAPSPSNT